MHLGVNSRARDGFRPIGVHVLIGTSTRLWKYRQRDAIERDGTYVSK
jgi:hypothetical protein